MSSVSSRKNSNGKIGTALGVSSALPRNRYKDRVRLDRYTDAARQSTDTTPVSKTPPQNGRYLSKSAPHHTDKLSARLTKRLTNLSSTPKVGVQDSHTQNTQTHKLEGARITLQKTHTNKLSTHSKTHVGPTWGGTYPAKEPTWVGPTHLLPPSPPPPAKRPGQEQSTTSRLGSLHLPETPHRPAGDLTRPH